MGRLCHGTFSSAARPNRPGGSNAKLPSKKPRYHPNCPPHGAAGPLDLAFNAGIRKRLPACLRQLLRPDGSAARPVQLAGGITSRRRGGISRQTHFPRFCSEATAQALSAPAFTFPGSLVKRPLGHRWDRSPKPRPPGLRQAFGHRAAFGGRPAGALFLTAFYILLDYSSFCAGCQTQNRSRCKLPRACPDSFRSVRREAYPRQIPMRRATVSISQVSGTNFDLPAMAFSGFSVTILFFIATATP